MNSSENIPADSTQPERIKFDVSNWVAEEQQLLTAEIEKIESSRPSLLGTLEEQIDYGRKSAELLGRYFELTQIAEKLANNL